MTDPRDEPRTEAEPPLVPGGSDRDAVVAWFTMCMEGSSAARRGTEILDRLLAEARAAERARLTPEALAAALSSIGASDLDRMVWSPFEFPERRVGDPDDNIAAEDPYPFASLARAILQSLE